MVRVHAPVEDKLLVPAEGLELVLREVHDDCSPTSGRFVVENHNCSQARPRTFAKR
jgi:hypothetical protein